MATLAPLATQDDVEERLGRALSPTEQLRVPALLKDASSQIRRFCRQDFLYHTGVNIDLRGRDSIIMLPDRTTARVNSVTAIGSSLGGGMGLPDLPVPWYVFDGIDKIRIDPGRGIINLPAIWWTSELYPQTFRVNRDYGYPAGVPDDVVMVCANATLRVLMAPNQAAGLIGETIGPYSYRLERSGSGLEVALNESDLEALRDYRQTERTIMSDLR
jgi:hypothetical protein